MEIALLDDQTDKAKLIKQINPNIGGWMGGGGCNDVVGCWNLFRGELLIYSCLGHRCVWIDRVKVTWESVSVKVKHPTNYCICNSIVKLCSCYWLSFETFVLIHYCCQDDQHCPCSTSSQITKTMFNIWKAKFTVAFLIWNCQHSLSHHWRHSLMSGVLEAWTCVVTRTWETPPIPTFGWKRIEKPYHPWN